jgi:hypothetical protein
VSTPWGYVIGGAERVIFVTKITHRGETLSFPNGDALIERVAEDGCSMELVFVVAAGQWKYARPIHADESTPLKEWCAKFDEAAT